MNTQGAGHRSARPYRKKQQTAEYRAAFRLLTKEPECPKTAGSVLHCHAVGDLPGAGYKYLKDQGYNKSTEKAKGGNTVKNILVVVDMQNDFVDGALGSKEASAIVPAAAEKIAAFSGNIFVTYDTHFENYMDTAEGKKLPIPHCIKGTDGWQLNADVAAALSGKLYTSVEKNTFGAIDLPQRIKEAVGDEIFSVELIGLCTDICVVSNALLLKAFFPEAQITVDAACCAGVTPKKHEAALETMRSCQIEVR